MTEFKPLENMLACPIGRGFLPKEDPIINLEGKQFQGLNEIMQSLPHYFMTGRIRGAHYIHKLPEWDIDQLNDREARALQRDLSFAAAAFYHAHNHKPAYALPQHYSVPLYKLAQRFQTKPTLSYYSYALTNFCRPNPDKPISLENIRIIRNFVNVLDEQWFIMVHVVIEAQAEWLINGILKAYEGLFITKNSTDVFTGLFMIERALAKMHEIMLQMPVACNPFVYYYQVRQQIMPFKNLIFNYVPEYKFLPQSFIAGETGAQSCIVPMLDAFFGIKHAKTEGFDFVREMRNYMPREHLDFIDSLEQGPSVRDAVIATKNNECHFNNGVKSLYNFRKLHFQYADDYIFQFKDKEEKKGTGGTPAPVWLNQLLEETLQAQIS